ncbi:disheveled-associated activator of morphogenesis 1 isoform X3 [Ctenocephalides felis]|nr:disheveled-associated activator of morphogenesis 1 isoform X3 [Ctenocephalides felis]
MLSRPASYNFDPNSSDGRNSPISSEVHDNATGYRFAELKDDYDDDDQGLPACPLTLRSLRERLQQWTGWPPDGGATGPTPPGGKGTHPQRDNNGLGAKGQRRRNMPALRNRRGWCGCLKDDEPPEITYCVVGHSGALSLQAVTPTQPMPSQEELDAKFAELVEELDLSAANKAVMLDLPAQKKWQIYCSRKGAESEEPGLYSGAPSTAEHYIERLQALADQLESSKSMERSLDQMNAGEQAALLEALRTSLRTAAHSFVLRFVELRGLHFLLRLLQQCAERCTIGAAGEQLERELIGCVKALMNNSTGRAHVLAHPTGIDTIAQSLRSEDTRTKIQALEILGAVCLVPGGHKKVLAAMMHYQKYAHERTRFQGIVNDLDRSTSPHIQPCPALSTALVSFINAVLSYGPGESDLEFRLHLRQEFLMLGLQPVLDELRSGSPDETLERHLDFFELLRAEDERQLARKFEEERVDTKSASAMFDLLRRKLSHTPAYPHLVSLLQHMLLLPLDLGHHAEHWLMFDRVLQQLVLQRPASGITCSEPLTDGDVTVITTQPPLTPAPNPDMPPTDPDCAPPLAVDVSALVKLLKDEQELEQARNKAEKLEMENAEVASKLAEKEQELDLRTQQKEDAESAVRRTKERLEKESAQHLQASQRLAETERRACELEQRLQQERAERERLQTLLQQGCTSDDVKVTSLKASSLGSPSLPPPPPPPPGLAPPMPPAPPPVAPIAPPITSSAPLAPAAPAPPMVSVFSNRPPPPQPALPLKSFNWCKLPEGKLRGTLWSELDGSKWYEALELESVDRMFSAYQKNGVANDGSVEDLRLVGKGRAKVLSVIDGRRAQNCTILLSKLKMTDEEICRAIMTMDESNQLPIDMLEQLLKFTPSPEEAALLDEHAEDIESLARADRFLYEISKIPHYEQRLRSLHYRKKFQTIVSELKPRVLKVLEASREVARSRRLRRLLELVLALGNYMNRGARGNASGFRLASLLRLADTKSGTVRGATLLHHVARVLERRSRDVLSLEEDLPHAREAAKVSLAELDKDVAFLRTGLAEVAREIDFHRSSACPTGGSFGEDRFLPVMQDFHAQASATFAELEDQFQDMKARFDRAVRLFGEDGSQLQPDEFFGIFDAFLTALAEAQHDNDACKRKREEDERRAKQDAELKRRTLERKHSREITSHLDTAVRSATMGSRTSSHHNHNSSNNNSAMDNNKGEFDDLISALRTGDVFGEDVAKFKRARKSKIAQNSNGTKGGSPPRRTSLNREHSRERVVINGQRAA